MSIFTRRCRVLAIPPLLAVLLVTAVAGSAPAEEPQWQLPEGLIVFTDLTMSRLVGRTGDADTFTANPGLDLFYSRDFGKLRFLGEIFLDEMEQELERLMLGRQIAPSTTAWLGRFHSPLGHWNTTFHHGTWLQNSISRPGIIEFEDKGGVLPTHITGLMAQGSVDLPVAHVSWGAGVGVGPKLDGEELHPYDLLEPSDLDRDLATAASLLFKRNKEAVSGLGFFAGYWDAERDQSIGGDLRLKLYGCNGKLQIENLLLQGAIFYVEDRETNGTGVSQSHFSSGYLQAEHQVDEDWTIYSRVELASNASESNYLTRFTEFVTEGYLGGVRYDLNNHNAIKLEAGDLRRLGTHSRRLMLQWSSRFP